MKTLTTPTTTYKNTKLGTEPNLILQINWSGGTAYYGYKTFSLGGWSISGKILDFSSVSSQSKQDISAEVSSATVVLDDSDGSLKTKVNREVLEGRTCIVYHHYDGLSQTDLIPILRGRIAGDVIWSEGTRQLSFSIESNVENNPIGYAPEAGDFADLDPKAIGVVWPFCFGTPLKVPAVRVKYRATGKLVSGINQNFTSFEVEGGEDFPQSTNLYVYIGSIKFYGSFNGNTFTVITANLPYHTNLDLANRPLNDPHYNDASVLWLAVENQVNLKGLYCLVNHPTHGYMVNFCMEQEGRKCYFSKPWRPSGTLLEVILNSSHDIDETAPVPRFSWPAYYTWEYIAQWYNTLMSYEHQTVTTMSTTLGGFFNIRAGASVNQIVGYNTTFVANLIPSIEILEVFGYRNFNGERIFAPIPKSYYITNLNNTLGAQNPTTLEFEIPLEDRIGEDWEGNVYVSLRSSKGPNAANVIKYLIQKYTSLSINTASFNSVATKLERYPANFSVFDRPNVLDICEDIAWQSRCALYIVNNTVYIIYLSESRTASSEVNESNTLVKTMRLSFTPTEDIYTRINVKYNYDYSDNGEREWIYSKNISTYGLREVDKDFFIYSHKSLVQLSAAFWGYRYANSWRRIATDSPLSLIQVEHFDCAGFDIAEFSTNTIRGVVDLVNHNPVDNVITLTAELASTASKVDGSYQPNEDTNYFTGDPSYVIGPSNPMPVDPGAGREEVDYEVPSSGQTNSDPNSDTGGTGGGGDKQYYLVFTTEPDEVQRSVNFSLAIEVRDIFGIKVSKNLTATLQLNSSDGSDTLNTTNISIVNGSWNGTALQITGGSGDDTGTISVAGSGYTGDTTEEFDIIAVRVDSLVWSGTPASVTRNSTIADFTLSGGLVGEVVNIKLNSTDAADKLYTSAGVVISQITLGAGGNYTFSGTYIAGGQGSKVGSLTADDVLKKYVEKTSTQFTIGGISILHVTSNINFSESSRTNTDVLQILPPSDIQPSEDFILDIQIQDALGAVATSYNETIRIEAYDDGGSRLNWLSIGPDGSNYTTFVLVDLINGEWAFSGTQLDIPNPTTYVRLEAEVLGKEGQFHDSVNVSVATIKKFVFTVAPTSTITRGVNFILTVEIQDQWDQVLTAEAPNATLTLDSDDPSDLLNKTSIATGEWVSGVWTNTTMQVNGGTGADFGDIEVSASGYVSDTTDIINIVSLKVYYLTIEPQAYVNSNNNVFVHTAPNGSYTDGTGYIGNAPASWAADSYDMTFKIWVDGVETITQTVNTGLERAVGAWFSLSQFHRMYGQSFKLPEGANITKIAFSVKANQGSGPGLCDVYVKETSPTGTVLFSGTVTPFAVQWYEVPVS